MSAPRLLSVSQVAARLGVTADTVRRWIRDGRAQTAGRTPGGQWRMTEAQADALLSGPPPSASLEEDVAAMLVAARMSAERALRSRSAHAS